MHGRGVKFRKGYGLGDLERGCRWKDTGDSEIGKDARTYRGNAGRWGPRREWGASSVRGL